MAQILVFGREGQVATALRQQKVLMSESNQTPDQNKDWVFVGSQEASFENPKNLEVLLQKYQPRVVINTSAYTMVDKAETEKNRAQLINAEAPREIARWCRQAGSALIHFSSDYVYPGTGQVPWLESDVTAPINAYGQSKLDGDLAIAAEGPLHLILRTSWIYSKSGVNFLNTMLRLGAEREELKIVSDQVGSPTSAVDLADVVLKLIGRDDFWLPQQSGVYHFAGAGFVSWFGFAQAIFENAKQMGMPLRIKNIIGIASSDYPTAAPRPLNSRMNQQKIFKEFGIQSSGWQDSLLKVMESYGIR